MANLDQGECAVVPQTSSTAEGDQSKTEKPQYKGSRPKRLNCENCADWLCEWQQDNPRRARTQAHVRWSQYSLATTVGEALDKGATFRDLDADHARSFLKVKEPIANSSASEKNIFPPKESSENKIEAEKTRRCRHRAQPSANASIAEKDGEVASSGRNLGLVVPNEEQGSVMPMVAELPESVGVGVQASIGAGLSPQTVDVGVQASTPGGDELALLTHETYRLRELLRRNGVPWRVINEASMGQRSH